MNDPVKPSDAACWSNYWASGALTSLPEDFQANYDGEIAAFWHKQAATLDGGAAVLDVCTGNGAVALLIAQAARDSGARLRITAIDAAEIRPDTIRQRFPQWSDLLSAIRFVGARPLEDLAMNPGSVDLITSQYGIEYCDWPGAARKCFELLKPGGRLAILAHSVSTDLLATMRREHEEYRTLEQLELTVTLRRRLDGALDWARFVGRIRAIHDQLTGDEGKRNSALFQYAASLTSGVLQMSEGQFGRQRTAVETACAQLDDGSRRLGQMLRVNQALHDNPRWTQVFVDAGLNAVDSGELIYRGRHKVGDWFVFNKPG